jgi:aminopeptidase
MAVDFEVALDRYADLAVRTGLNLQPDQRLMVADPTIRFGVPHESAPFIRAVAKAAYAAGASSVEPLWGDAQLTVLALAQRGRDWIESFPDWRYAAAADHVHREGAYLSVHSYPPNLLEGLDVSLVAEFQRRTIERFYPTASVTRSDGTNRCVLAAPTASWADRVLPHLPQEARLPKLWDLVFRMCRVDQPDPVAAWQEHGQDLAARCACLNAKAYDALHYTAQGTDLTIGLPPGHRWQWGGSTAISGVPFIANMPTEEVYTLPDRRRADGTVTASMPLSRGGGLIEGIRLAFEGGRVADAHADVNDSLLASVLSTDEGAARLGEVALVPHSSPVAQSGVLFYDTLFDENAACHLALGYAYTSSLEGGDDMDQAAFLAAGGNQSKIHVDFMIGSDRMDIDGLTAEGRAEPVMRSGEWAIDA